MTKPSMVVVLAVAIVLLAGGLWLWPWLSQRRSSAAPPGVAGSPGTTYITGPLRPDGSPDYLGYFRERQLRGHDRSDNALIPLLRALGPAALRATGTEADVVVRELGLEALPKPSAPFVPFDVFVRGERCKDAAKSCVTPLVQAMEDGCDGKPLTADTRNLVTRWLSSNGAAFEAFHEAMSRPALYLPLDAMGLNTVSTIPFLQLQKAHQCLARFEWEAGRVGAALDIIADSWRRGGLGDPQQDLLAVMIGIVAWRNTRAPLGAVLSTGQVDEALARKALAQIDRLTIVKDLHALFLHERLSELHTWTEVLREAEASGGVGLAGYRIGGYRLDPGRVLRRMNVAFDEMDSALTLPWGARSARLQAIGKRHSASGKSPSLRLAVCMIPLASELCEDQLGEQIASWAVTSTAMTLGKQIDKVTQTAAARDQLRIALALEVQRVRTGEYPSRLEQLDLTLLGPMPRDPTSGQLFGYHRVGDGYDLLDAGFIGDFDPAMTKGGAIRVRRARAE